MYNIHMDMKEFRRKLKITAFINKRESSLMSPSQYSAIVKYDMDWCQANSDPNNVNNETDVNRETKVIITDFDGFMKVLLDFNERISTEFRKREDIRFKHSVVKFAVKYPLSDYSIKSIIYRLSYLIGYMHSDIRRYYPIIYAKRTVNKPITNIYTYFYMYLPLYDFVNHREVDSDTLDNIVNYGIDSLYETIGDSKYCKDIEFSTLNTIYKSKIEWLKSHNCI